MSLSSLNVLIIDDELAIRQILQTFLSNNGYEVQTAASGAEAIDLFKEQYFDIAFCDVRLGDCIGIDLIKQLKSEGIETEFIVMTAFASVSTAIEAMRVGAFDYLMKPMRNEDILHRIKQLQNVLELKKENTHLRGLITDNSANIYTPQSESMKQLMQMAEKVARSDRDVLITGESGTGKGVLTRELHRISNRANGPLVLVNCAAIPETLLESELFGHVKGAFTGADKNKTGLCSEANGGILFLDEIGELPLSMQAKLLHVIENKKVRPVGSNKHIPVNIRIIAATNCDLPKMITEKQFREDLFFRLQVLQLELPPLRERHGDIEPLIKFFIHKECQRAGINQTFTIDEDAKECMLNYDYPGNLREMENTFARAVALAEDFHITVTDLPPVFFKNHTTGSQATSLRMKVRQYEIKLINDALIASSNDRRKASEILGIGLSSLYRKLEEIEEENEN